VPLIVLKATLTDDRPVFFDLAQLICEPTLIIAACAALVIHSDYALPPLPATLV
jgi:hypothetical protein